MLLADLGCQVTACDSASATLRKAEQLHPALLVTCTGGDASLETTLESLKRANPEMRILLIAEQASSTRLPGLVRLGIDELVFLPINAARCVETLRSLLETKSRKEPSPNSFAQVVLRSAAEPQPSVQLPSSPAQPASPSALPAASPSMRSLLKELRALPDNTQILILRGEAGSEFELVAREFHALQGGQSPCLPVLDANTLDDESLRDAIAMGRLRNEPICTLLIKDVEELSAPQQSDLSAILLEEKRRRSRGKPVNFVLCFNEESHLQDFDLIEELLFHRTTVLRIEPLRERPEDLEGIAQHALAQLSILFPSCRARALDNSALDWLRSRLWKGNHREFLEVVREGILHCPIPVLSAAFLARCAGESISASPPAMEETKSGVVA